MQAGAVAFLGKPFSDELLLETLRITLRDIEPSAKTA
jgi:FixJ family two-component response regulator